MATSGSYNLQLTASNIVVLALEDIGVLAPGQTISNERLDFGLRRLNVIAKQWQGTSDMANGLKVHTRQRVTLFLAKGQQTYTIGPASTDSRATTSYGRTTISAAEAIGQTTLSVTATTDTTTNPGTTVTMTAADIIGIELDDGTIQWSTISSTGAGTVTVADSLTVAAASGNYVWWFTSRAQRFMVTESAVTRDENRNDFPIHVFRTSDEYDAGVADKYADGDPSAILIEPLRLNTRVTLDSQPTDVTKQIVLTVLYPAEDYDASSNDIAFPQEWYGALEWELAKRCASSFGRPWTTDMEANWLTATSIARNLNPEVSDLYFRCDA